MNKIKIAIIILTYRSEHLIQGCLDSLRKNISADLDVSFFIIDNNSPDNTAEILKKIDASSQDIFVTLNKDNIGFAAGINQGLRKAKKFFDPDFFLIFNPDAKLEKDSLKKLVAAAKSDPNVGALSPRIIDIETKKNIFCGGKISWLKMKNDHFKKNPTKIDYITGCSLFITKPVLEKKIFLDEKFFLYYEDADFSIKLKKAGFKLKMVPDAICLHKESQSSNSETKTYHLSKNGPLFFYKHYPSIFRPYFWTVVYCRKFYHQYFSKKESVKRGINDFIEFTRK